MRTEIVKIDEYNIDRKELQRAAIILQNNGLVAFPTETVYGLGANALDESASAKIYGAKGRPSDNPLIVHISRMDMVDELARDISQDARQIMEAFWPGPLTVILNKKDIVPKGTTGGLDTVAIRMPSHTIARELIDISGLCIAAPSANTSGRPSPTTAAHVAADMNGRIEMIVDGGAVGIGIESTIVDLTGDIPVILRPGYITKPMLSDVIHKNIETDPAILGFDVANDVAPKAPGMKYKHYAPKGDLSVVRGSTQKAVTQRINLLTADKISQGFRVGIIATEETKADYPQGIVKSVGFRELEMSISSGLYGVLRDFDEDMVDFIYSESFGHDEFGQAIMNRLLKAAGHQIVEI